MTKEDNINIKKLQEQIKKLTIKVEKLENINNEKKLDKKEIKIKDPNKPKRNLSSYMFFYKEFRKEYSDKNPNTNSKLIAIEAGKEWNKIKENPKKVKKYNDMVDKDKQRYIKEIREYNKIK